MKKLIETVIRLRNPKFEFDKNLSSFALVQFILIQACSLIRGFRFVLFLKKPKAALFGRKVRLFNVPKIYFGKFLKLGNYVSISALGEEGAFFGNNVGIGDYSKVIVSTSLNDIGSFIKIGDNVGIGEFAYLGGAGGLTIGDNCIVGQYLSCHPENHIYEDKNELIRLQGVVRKGIHIGSNCWIGSKVTFLDGVTIGNGCVVAAGSVVTKSFPDYSVIGGVPAKLLKTRE